MSDTNLEGGTQGSFQQSLVEIGSVVLEEKIFFKFHPMKFKKKIFSESTEPTSSKLC
jgi:hypothetical protein